MRFFQILSKSDIKKTITEYRENESMSKTWKKISKDPKFSFMNDKDDDVNVENEDDQFFDDQDQTDDDIGDFSKPFADEDDLGSEPTTIDDNLTDNFDDGETDPDGLTATEMVAFISKAENNSYVANDWANKQTQYTKNEFPDWFSMTSMSLDDLTALQSKIRAKKESGKRKVGAYKTDRDEFFVALQSYVEFLVTERKRLIANRS